MLNASYARMPISVHEVLAWCASDTGIISLLGIALLGFAFASYLLTTWWHNRYPFIELGVPPPRPERKEENEDHDLPNAA